MSKEHEHLIRDNGDNKAAGLRPVTEFDGIRLFLLNVAKGQTEQLSTECETAWLLMHGKLRVTVGGETTQFERASLFDESASCLHVCSGSDVTLEALTDCELTVYRCDNQKDFPARVITPDDVPNEHRGAGQVASRCLRFVRTIFDGSSSHENTELVLGEVVTLPGGWSSYPPHHHPQPEIYHYRFTEPQGYGHAELGDDVLKVHDRDTVRITPGLDHAQCAAPGYGMYYAWVIRHLPDNRYTIPDFTEEHRWTMDKDAAFWWPAGIARD